EERRRLLDRIGRRRHAAQAGQRPGIAWRAAGLFPADLRPLCLAARPGIAGGRAGATRPDEDGAAAPVPVLLARALVASVRTRAHQATALHAARLSGARPGT